MGTKNDPGEFDCYAKARPDEPLFVLLARDPAAPFVVAFWTAIHEAMGDTSSDKLGEAHAVSKDMADYFRARGGSRDDVERARRAMQDLLHNAPRLVLR